MKKHIQLTSGRAIDEIHKAQSIIEYMQALSDKFEEEGILRDYKRGCIPNQKKSKPLEINKAGLADKNPSKWIQTRKPLKIDNEFKGKLKNLANEIERDNKTHDKEVHSYQAIKTLCDQEKVKICKGCGSINCALWETLARKSKHLSKFLGDCDGVPAKFGNLSKFTPKYISETKGKQQTTTSSPPANTVIPDMNMEDFQTSPKIIAPVANYASVAIRSH